MLALPKARRAAAIEKAAREQLRGIIRAHKPGAIPLAAGMKAKGSDALPYAHGKAYLVRLSVEFDLPPELMVVASEAKVRVLRVKFGDGSVETLPRANVEMIES